MGGGGGPGGHACGFLFNFSKEMENANNDKTIDFFHIFSDVAIGSENSPSLRLKYHRLLCYTTDINL